MLINKHLICKYKVFTFFEMRHPVWVGGVPLKGMIEKKVNSQEIKSILTSYIKTLDLLLWKIQK